MTTTPSTSVPSVWTPISSFGPLLLPHNYLGDGGIHRLTSWPGHTHPRGATPAGRTDLVPGPFPLKRGAVQENHRDKRVAIFTSNVGVSRQTTLTSSVNSRWPLTALLHVYDLWCVYTSTLYLYNLTIRGPSFRFFKGSILKMVFPV